MIKCGARSFDRAPKEGPNAGQTVLSLAERAKQHKLVNLIIKVKFKTDAAILALKSTQRPAANAQPNPASLTDLKNVKEGTETRSQAPAIPLLLAFSQMQSVSTLNSQVTATNEAAERECVSGASVAREVFERSATGVSVL